MLIRIHHYFLNRSINIRTDRYYRRGEPNDSAVRPVYNEYKNYVMQMTKYDKNCWQTEAVELKSIFKQATLDR